MTEDQKKDLKKFGTQSAIVAVIFFVLSQPALYNMTEKISPKTFGQGKMASVVLHAVVAGVIAFAIMAAKWAATQK